MQIILSWSRNRIQIKVYEPKMFNGPIKKILWISSYVCIKLYEHHTIIILYFTLLSSNNVFMILIKDVLRIFCVYWLWQNTLELKYYRV